MADAAPATPERTPTGEIKDQTPPPTPDTPPEPVKAEEKPSVLNEKTPAAAGAPEKYSDFTPPEGFDLNEEAMAKAEPIFRELGLTQAQAQRMVDFYAEISKSSAEAPYKLWEDT